MTGGYTNHYTIAEWPMFWPIVWICPQSLRYNLIKFCAYVPWSSLHPTIAIECWAPAARISLLTGNVQEHARSVQGTVTSIWQPTGFTSPRSMAQNQETDKWIRMDECWYNAHNSGASLQLRGPPMPTALVSRQPASCQTHIVSSFNRQCHSPSWELSHGAMSVH